MIRKDLSQDSDLDRRDDLGCLLATVVRRQSRLHRNRQGCVGIPNGRGSNDKERGEAEHAADQSDHQHEKGNLALLRLLGPVLRNRRCLHRLVNGAGLG